MSAPSSNICRTGLLRIRMKTLLLRLRKTPLTLLSNSSLSLIHIYFKHLQRRGKVTVPHPNKDLKRKTLDSIERQSGLRFR